MIDANYNSSFHLSESSKHFKKNTMTESEKLTEIKALIEKNNQQMEKRFQHLENKTDDISQKLKEFDIRIETY
jgi:Na+/phosphate symporter